MVHRIRLAAPNVLHDQITIEDPVVLEKPITYTLAYSRMPDYEMVEFICENNREFVACAVAACCSLGMLTGSMRLPSCAKPS